MKVAISASDIGVDDVVESIGEIHREFECGGETFVRIDLERSVEHRPQRLRNRFESVAVEFALADVEEHRHFVRPGAERLHQEHFRETDAEREKVGPAIHFARIGGFRAQVADLAFDDAVFGVFFAVAGPRNAEIGELDLAVVGDEDIAWADVAVDDLLRLAVR